MKRYPAGRGLLGWAEKLADMQARQRAAARGRQQARAFANQETLGLHDSGGLGTAADLDGVEPGVSTQYCGSDLEGNTILRPIGCSAVIGARGIGKGVSCIQPNCGWLGNDVSLVAVGLGHEAYRVSSDYRRDELGQLVVANNLSGEYGIPSVTLDPLLHIREAGERGDFRNCVEYCRQAAINLVPEKKGEKADTPWVVEDTQNLANMLVAFTGLERPELCNLPALSRLLSASPREMLSFINENANHPFVRTRMVDFIEDLEADAEKQLHWKVSKLRKALPYEPGTELGDGVSGEPFDVAELRRRPGTLYIELNDRQLATQGDHIVLTLTSVVERLAETEGPQDIVIAIDEASSMPRMNLGAWQRTLRKRKIHFWHYWQSIASIEEIYGKTGRIDILANCDTIQYLTIDDTEVARRLSERAGYVSALGRSMNFGADGRSASDNINEMRKPRLPVADIMNMGRWSQLVDIRGAKLIKGRRHPWWNVYPISERLKRFEELDAKRTSKS